MPFNKCVCPVSHSLYSFFQRGVMLCEIARLNQTFSSTSFVERITCQFLIHMVCLASHTEYCCLLSYWWRTYAHYNPVTQSAIRNWSRAKCTCGVFLSHFSHTHYMINHIFIFRYLLFNFVIQMLWLLYYGR